MSWRDDVDFVVDSVDFTHPVEIADCKAVQASLRAALPEGAKVEVYERGREGVVVDVRVDGEPYKRTKKVLR